MLTLIIRLFPRAEAWRIAIGSWLRKLLDGFASLPAAARIFIDRVYEQLAPGSVDAENLADWERQFGINFPSASETDRRLAIAAKWAATGGQSPQYIEDTLQAAGFNVYVHEWWVPPNEAPRTARDPRDYANQPLIGQYQCIPDSETQHECTDVPNGPQCTEWLMNEVNYIVNDNLTPIAPPPIPSDPDRWRFFIYIGAETFPNFAEVSMFRRDEFRELLLTICPAQQWIVTLVDYVQPLATLITEGGDTITTEDGDVLTS